MQWRRWSSKCESSCPRRPTLWCKQDNPANASAVLCTKWWEVIELESENKCRGSASQPSWLQRQVVPLVGNLSSFRIFQQKFHVLLWCTFILWKHTAFCTRNCPLWFGNSTLMVGAVVFSNTILMEINEIHYFQCHSYFKHLGADILKCFLHDF